MYGVPSRDIQTSKFKLELERIQVARFKFEVPNFKFKPELKLRVGESAGVPVPVATVLWY